MTTPEGQRRRPNDRMTSRRWQLRAVIAASVLAGVVVVLIVVVATFAPRLISYTGTRALPWDRGALDVGGAEVGARRLVLTRVRLDAGPHDTFAADTVVVEFRPHELVGSARRLRSVRVVGARIEAQAGDSGWVWLPTRDRGGRPLHIDRLAVTGAVLHVRDQAGESLLLASGLDVMIDSLRTGPAGARFDSEVGVAALRSPWIGTEAGIAATADMDASGLLVRRLVVDAGSSGRLEAHGRLAAAMPDGARRIDFEIGGENIAAASLHPRLDVIDPERRARVAVDVEGTTRDLRFGLTADFQAAGSIEGRGRLRGVARARTLTADLAVRELDVADLTAGRADVSPVGGDVAVRLELTPGGVSGPVRIDLASSVGGRPARVQGSAEVAERAGSLDLNGELFGLPLRVSGDVAWRGDVPGYDILIETRSQLPGRVLDLPGVERAEWLASARVQGQGVDARTMTADVDAVIEAVAHRAAPTRLTVRVEGREGAGPLARLSIDRVGSGLLQGARGDLTFSTSSGTSRLTGRLSRGESRVELRDAVMSGGTLNTLVLNFSGIDPSAFVATLPTGSLAGRLTLEPITPGRLGGTLELESSRLGNAPIAGTVAFRGDASDAFSFDTRLEGDDQLVVAAGRARVGERQSITIDSVMFRNLDPSSWSGGRGPGGRLSGRGGLTATRGGPAGLEGRLDVSVQAASTGGRVYGPATVTASLAGRNAEYRATAEVAGTRATFQGSATLDHPDAWRGDAALQLVGAPADTLDLDVAFATAGSGADGPTARVEVTGDGRLAAVALDTVLLEMGMARDVIQLGRLMVAGPAVRVDGSGSLPLEGSAVSAGLVVHAAVEELGDLAPMSTRGVSGRGELRFESTGMHPTLTHAASIRLDELETPSARLESLSVDLLAHSDSTRWLAEAEVEARVENVEGKIGAYFISPGVDTAAEARGDVRLRWNRDHSPRTLEIERLTGEVDGADWNLARPATIRWGDGIEIAALDIRSASGSIAAAGRIDPRSTQALDVRMQGVPLRLRDARGTVFGAELDLAVDLDGPATDPRLGLHAALRSSADSMLNVTAEWTARGLAFEAGIREADGGSLHATGRYPLRLSLHPDSAYALRTDDTVSVAIEAGQFDVGHLQPFARALEGLAGRADGRMRVGGTGAAPHMEGSVRLTALRADVPLAGTRLRDGRLELVASGDSIRILDGRIGDGGEGELTVDGAVRFPRVDSADVGLEAVFRHFRIAGTPRFEASVSGTLAASGAASAPELRGRVRVDQGTVVLDGSSVGGGVEPVELTAEDYAEIERRFGLVREPVATQGVEAWAGLDVDVTVVAESNLWLRRLYEPALAIELAGDVRALKPRGGVPGLFGEVRVVEGRSFIDEFGRRFAIASGRVRFDGPPAGADLVAEAVYDPVEDVRITLGLRGNAEGFALTLGSEPQMDQTDIVSYIAVGMPAAAVADLGGDAARGGLAAGAGFALSRVTGQVQEMARQRLGLDVVEIEQNGLQGLTLEAGRYVTRRLYVGFDQPALQGGTAFGIDQTEVKAEYRLATWLLAHISGSRDLARFFLRVRRAY